MVTHSAFKTCTHTLPLSLSLSLALLLSLSFSLSFCLTSIQFSSLAGLSPLELPCFRRSPAYIFYLT